MDEGGSGQFGWAGRGGSREGLLDEFENEINKCYVALCWDMSNCFTFRMSFFKIRKVEIG